MTAKLAAVSRCHRKPWPSMVTFLREKLAQAEGGELAGLAIAYEYDDGTTGYRTFHDRHSNPAKLIGCLELVQYEITTREVERRNR